MSEIMLVNGIYYVNLTLLCHDNPIDILNKTNGISEYVAELQKATDMSAVYFEKSDAGQYMYALPELAMRIIDYYKSAVMKDEWSYTLMRLLDHNYNVIYPNINKATDAHKILAPDDDEMDFEITVSSAKEPENSDPSAKEPENSDPSAKEPENNEIELKKSNRKYITKNMRFCIFKMHQIDGVTKCAMCGKELEYETMECGHNIPIARNGKTEISNLKPSCTKCGRKRGIMTMEEYRNILTSEK